MRKVWIVIALGGLLGCGKAERPSPVVELEMRQVPVEIRELVPRGAHALLYMESARRVRMLASRTNSRESVPISFCSGTTPYSFRSSSSDRHQAQSTRLSLPSNLIWTHFSRDANGFDSP